MSRTLFTIFQTIYHIIVVFPSAVRAGVEVFISISIRSLSAPPPVVEPRGPTLADLEIPIADQSLSEAQASASACDARHWAESAHLGVQEAQHCSAESHQRFYESEIRLETIVQILECQLAKVGERVEEGDIMLPGAATNQA